MGPLIALILFSLVIGFGFIVEAQARGKVTHATWLPLFWMVICATRSIGQWINLGPALERNPQWDASLRGSLVDQIVLLSVIVLGLMIIFRRKGTLVRILRYGKPLLVFTLYLGLTVLWSDFEEVSFRRWIRLFGSLVMAGVLMSEPDPIESIRSIFRRCAYLLIPLSVVFVKYFPLIGVLHTRLGEKMWVGAALMKNGLAHLCLIMAFFLIWDATRTWRLRAKMNYSRLLFDAVVLVMCLWLLRGPGNASSSASIGSLIVGIALLVILNLPVAKANVRVFGILAILAASLFIVLEASFGLIEIVVSSLGRDMTFTDRVPLWNTLVEAGLQKPFFGYGYSSFWTEERITTLEFSQAHNGFLEIFLDGGLVAMTLLGALLISVFYKIQKDGLIDYEYAVYRLSLVVIILLTNVTESGFARERDLLTIVFYIIALNDGPFRRIVCPSAGVCATTVGARVGSVASPSSSAEGSRGYDSIIN